jgi:hypothetical protein
MADLDLTKAEIYHTLYQLNAAFSEVIAHCRTLQKTGLFSSKANKLFPSFAREMQAEFNQEFLETLHQMELDDWGRYGEFRQKRGKASPRS